MIGRLAYKNTIIPQANADAYKLVADAESYKQNKISTAEGDIILLRGCVFLSYYIQNS